ncbi:MAG: phosphate/phosphite/phosphonate ABC transporter substrate-binding protein [Deltaproteobacteria bacterium]|nr:phosphate/phosphite/phosphonate ABC transporter substrate-binding protein [Deltaproteobacteria bacterium]
MKKKHPAIIPLMLGMALIILIAGQSKAGAHDLPNVIKFGVYPYESPRSAYTLYAPVAKRIEEKTGHKVELVSAPDHESFMEKAVQGDYDLALVCVNCLFTVQPAGYQVIARGEPSFYGATIVRSDSDINAPGQLRGKKIAAIGKHSYAGYLYLRDELSGLGISPDKEVQFNFLNKVDSIILSVINKQYDAGVIRLDTLAKPNFAAVRNKVRIISNSPETPQFPFVVKNNMAQNTRQQIREVLTSLTPGNAEDQDVLQSLQIERIVPATDSDYVTIRQVIEKIKK